MVAQLLCPTCRRQVEWSDQFPYRPFCSERCRLTDLGAWLSEQRAIPDDSPEPGDQIASNTDDPGEAERR